MAETLRLVRPEPRGDGIIEVEQALLGALMMTTSAALRHIPAQFSPEHYLDDFHRDIHEHIAKTGDGSPLTIMQALGSEPEDRKYLAGLIAGYVGSGATREYAEAITEAFYRRKAAAIAEKVLEDVRAGSAQMPSSAIVSGALAQLDALLAGTHQSSPGRNLNAALDAALDKSMAASRGEDTPGRSTGMASVDEVLGRFEDETFNVLAARPGMGKSGLGMQWGINVAKACKAAADGGQERAGVGVFSLEMSAVSLGRRALAAVAGVSVIDIKRGRIDGRVDALTGARHELDGLPFWIEDAGGQNLVAIRQKCRSMVRRFGRLALLVVDHINIVLPDEIDRKNGATQAVGRISNALRDLSKEFHCPVLALAQLNRGLLSRDDKRPNLGDLRQAGDIEQDADAVMFVHREEALLPKSPPEQGETETDSKYEARVKAYHDHKERCRGRAELIFEKIRDGQPKTVHLRFDGPTTSFSEMPAKPHMQQLPLGNIADWHDKFQEPEGLWPNE